MGLSTVVYSIWLDLESFWLQASQHAEGIPRGEGSDRRIRGPGRSVPTISTQIDAHFFNLRS
jgi:hypothetical protein